MFLYFLTFSKKIIAKVYCYIFSSFSLISSIVFSSTFHFNNFYYEVFDLFLFNFLFSYFGSLLFQKAAIQSTIEEMKRRAQQRLPTIVLRKHVLGIQKAERTYSCWEHKI